MERKVRSIGQHEIVPRRQEFNVIREYDPVTFTSGGEDSGGNAETEVPAKKLDTPDTFAVYEEVVHYSEANEPFVDVIISFEGDDAAIEFDVRISDLELEVSTST